MLLFTIHCCVMDSKIDLNQAGVDELAALPGIGMKLAQRIVIYREEVHPFEEVIELTAVSGISERMVRKIEGEVVVETAVALPDEEAVAGAVAETAAEAEIGEVEELLRPDLPEVSRSDTFPEAEVEMTEADKESESIETSEPTVTETEAIDLSEIVEAAPMKEGVPMTQARPDPVPPASRNRSLIGGMIGAIFGAILGSVLTLAILSSLNGGTLYFASQERADEMRQALDVTVESVRGEQIDLSGNVEAMGGELATVAAAGQAQMTAIEADVDDLQATAVSLQDEIADTEERLDNVAESAENFDAFLNGLRDLVVDFRGVPATATPTATATPSPSPVPTETESVAATAVATETATSPPATRTRRPTATPLVTATATE